MSDQLRWVSRHQYTCQMLFTVNGVLWTMDDVLLQKLPELLFTNMIPYRSNTISYNNGILTIPTPFYNPPQLIININMNEFEKFIINSMINCDTRQKL